MARNVPNTSVISDFVAFPSVEKSTWKLSDKRLTVLLRRGGDKSMTGRQLIKAMSGFNSNDILLHTWTYPSNELGNTNLTVVLECNFPRKRAFSIDEVIRHYQTALQRACQTMNTDQWDGPETVVRMGTDKDYPA